MVPIFPGQKTFPHRFANLKCVPLNGCALRIYGDIELGGWLGMGEAAGRGPSSALRVTSLEREHVGADSKLLPI